MNQFTSLVEYRDNTQFTDDELVPVDDESVVTGLQGFGIMPYRSRTDGKKLVYDFVKAEVAEPFQLIQKSLAGAVSVISNIDLHQKITLKTNSGESVEYRAFDIVMDFYNRLNSAKTGWKGSLTMMRNIPIVRI